MKKIFLLLCFLPLFLTSCSDEDQEFETACGVVFQGELENPIKADDGDEAYLSAVTGRGLVTVRLEKRNEAVLVALHGIENERISEEMIASAQASLQKILDSGDTFGYFYRAEKNCQTRVQVGGANQTVAIPGRFILSDGTSLAEKLLSEGNALVEREAACKSQLVKACYNGLLLEGLS